MKKCISATMAVLIVLSFVAFTSSAEAGQKLPKAKAPSNAAFIELCRKGTPLEVEKAIKAGANVNPEVHNNMTPLMTAARSNSNPEVITTLLKHGADLNATYWFNGPWTVLNVAVLGSNPAVITTLIKHGADVNAKTDSDWTALMTAAMYNSNPEVMAVLIQNGADVNAKDESGMTALIAAATHNSNPAIIAELTKNGADINAKDSSGKRAIDYAKANPALKNTNVLNMLM